MQDSSMDFTGTHLKAFKTNEEHYSSIKEENK